MSSSALKVLMSSSAFSMVCSSAFAVGFAAARSRSAASAAVAQPVERRLQVVGDVVGDLPQAAHQPSMRSSMSLRFADSASSSPPRAAIGNALRQVAVHDRAAGDVDRLDAAAGRAG